MAGSEVSIFEFTRTLPSAFKAAPASASRSVRGRGCFCRAAMASSKAASAATVFFWRATC
jgi:hypothetical protein